MSEPILSASCFHNEEAAYRFVESCIWPNGPVCPHCGGVERNRKMRGKSTRIGTNKCYDCRKPFTVKVGTIFESSHIPMRLWLRAIFLISASKKSISSNELHRTLGITLKSAWFMSHRIREAMRDGGLATFGGNGGALKVLSLVDRSTGRSRSMVVDNLEANTLLPILQADIDRESRVLPDEAGQYRNVQMHFRDHGFVRHGVGEYGSKTDKMLHTNTIEGFFSIFNRGMKGVYQHCGHNHLNRYLAEFDFRYNNRIALGVDDNQRAENLLRGVKGKRLTYQTTC